MQTDDFHVFDTTLRDGAQREGISYSVADKLAVARLLDQIGVGFVEGGWPGALPKDTEFFARAASGELVMRHATLVAFGATRKAGVPVEQDAQVRALLDSQAAVVTLVAKSDVRHVGRALRTTLEENLAMVHDTVAFLRAHGRRVFLDCEHFFDGYRHDRDYGVRVLDAAAAAGADVGVLCDTNGGMLPMGVHAVVSEVAARVGLRLGIHTQDDTGCAVANTLAAVDAGATHVQGTANGYGERAGNANIFSVIGGLVTKMGYDVLPEGCLPELVRVSHAIAEIANLAPDTHAPYVGAAAFAHKAGLHASAIKVDPELYNHLDPQVVGNDQRILVTEMAGRASIELKSAELGVDVTDRPDVVGSVVEHVKQREAAGWSYEAADASFELLLRDELDGADAVAPFEVESYRVIIDHRADAQLVSEATVKLHAGGRRVISTEEGNGPVNALDRALRNALEHAYPQLARMELTDYKVRIMPGRHGTDAVTRVLIETGDHERAWSTVGVHGNVIEASWLALHDAVRFGLLGATVARTGNDPRTVHATRDIAAPAATLFELIADPAEQPRWDGNANVIDSRAGQRVREVGDVFVTTVHSGTDRENHVVEFVEGALIAWRPADVGAAPAGHLWRWELESLDAGRTRVTHTYDWSQLTDEKRFARARATTPDMLDASLARLAELAAVPSTPR